MFDSVMSDQNSHVLLIQQCLANYDYSNATAIAEDLLLLSDSEENKGLLADCYLSQQENQKAYFLLSNSISPPNLYKLAVACLRLNKLTEAEGALLRNGGEVPNGVHGIELLATVFRKQGKLQEARSAYEAALNMAPMLLSTKKELEKLKIEIQPKVNTGGLLGGNYSAGNSGQGFGQKGGLFGKAPEKKAEDNDFLKKVDEYFDEQDCEVYAGNDGQIYSKVLANCRIENNENKFFIIQVLKSKGEEGVYWEWYRWGRVGVKGQTSKTKIANAGEAVMKFEAKIAQKIGENYQVMDF